ncbi:MAG: DUF58 domain-containing protein [Candidatus Promineifilaceae bacterium]|nr:DUF58 domain-containing protein [Candidatus Promineifilaceae bacterium]
MLIFDESVLRKLEQLTLVADQVRVGIMKGDRRSRKRGTSVEFADYRNYTKGDDLRRLDWNVYARLGRPFIKLLEEEEDLAVHVLVDASASMDWPEGEEANKLRYALILAGALGHVGLATGDQVSATLLTGRGEGMRRWGPFRGRQNSLRLLQFLESAEAGGVTNLNVSLQDVALRGGRPGLLFLLSDMLTPAGYRDGVNALQARGYEVGVIHILSPDEVDPPLAGDLKLIDVETGSDAELTLDATTLDRYRERLQAWQAELAAYCRGRGVHYVPVITDTPWERLVMQTLRAQGVLT